MRSPFFILIYLIFQTLSISTFGQSENLTFSHKHGFYYDPFNLMIASSVEDSEILYTLDGSNPISSNSFLEGKETVVINIDPSNTLNRDVSPAVIVRACITHSDTLVGKIITQTYIFPKDIINYSIDNYIPGNNWPGFDDGISISYGLDPLVYNSPLYSNQILESFLDIPTISLVTDPDNLFNPDSGIYVNSLKHGRDWERDASLELLNPNGEPGFQENCGIRIRGGWSRHTDNPKHAFRVFFRKEYGEGKLNYPLFGNEGVDEYDNIDLRTSQNYSWSYYGDNRNTFLRDVFSRDTQRDMEQPYTRSRYYHLFLNGIYWGLYQTQERSEASFAESYFGGNEDDYDVIKVETNDDFTVREIEATDGTLDKWKHLWDLANEGFDDFNYFKAQGLNTDGTRNTNYDRLIDVDNLIDYMIITIFTGDFDGPVSAFSNNEKPNNFFAIINRVNPDGFKFFRHDAEHTLLNHPWGIDRTGPFPAGDNFLDSNPQWIHQKLSNNTHYRKRFADRVYKHFFNGGALTYEKNKERIEERKKQIELAIIAESARWGDSKREPALTKADWENEVNYLLNTYLPTRNNVVLNQFISKNLFFSNNIPLFNKHGGIVEKGFEVSISSQSGNIYYTIDGSDPVKIVNGASYLKEIISADSPKKILIPSNDIFDDWKTKINFNDSNWITVNSQPGGIGYDTKNIYDTYISYNTLQQMHESGNNPNTSCLIRIKFKLVSEDVINANTLKLNIRYDDGFIIYLNGKNVLSVNSPDNPTWNSTALNYMDSQGIEVFDLSDFISDLSVGDNLLAIQGLNYSTQSSDFLILPTLQIGNSNIDSELSASAIKYSEPIIIDETKTIKARSILDNEWSVLSEAKFKINENLSTLKITEIHYHPLDNIIGSDTISGKKYEFVELKNIGKTEINLTGSKFVKGISFEFPSGSILQPNEFVVLASDSTYFEGRYGFNPNYQFKGNLDNSGERLTFVNPIEDTVFTVRFNDKPPWPVEADGEGYSLVSKFTNPITNPDDVNYWLHSSEINGSPFSDDVVSGIDEAKKKNRNEFYLSYNYPNPFNPETTISFSIPNTFTGNQKSSIIIYDVLGRKIKTLINEVKQPGNYKVTFNGSKLSSGVYYYQLKTGEFIKTRKMILIK